MSTLTSPDFLAEVARYYAGKLAYYGETPLGVDWNGEESQCRRFEQLCKIVDIDADFSINDLGCGYGAMFNYLANKYSRFSYYGTDVSEEMILAAIKLHGADARVRFLNGSKPFDVADFGVASGIFNVRLNYSDDEWLAYIHSILVVLNNASRRGFAFNCLTSYSDPDKMRDHLYYADPCLLFDFCKRRFSRQVALLHDYGLYEFTILVRKE